MNHSIYIADSWRETIPVHFIYVLVSKKYRHTVPTAPHRAIAAQSTSMGIPTGNIRDIEASAPVDYIQIIAHFIGSISFGIGIALSQLTMFKNINKEQTSIYHNTPYLAVPIQSVFKHNVQS